MIKLKNSWIAFCMICAVAFTACSNDDDPIPTKETVVTKTIDASAYDAWVYFDFEKETLVSKPLTKDGDNYTLTADETLFDWDIAIHRNNIRTNNGGAIETNATQITDKIEIPDSGYKTDEPTSEDIVVDMSKIMQSIIVYMAGDLNPVLKQWLVIDTNQMPPAYNYSNKVYLIKTKEGKHIKIKFSDYKSDTGKTGHVSFEYVIL